MAKDLHYYASRGMLGHSALLDPEAFVAQAPPEMQAIGQMGPPDGELVAKNSVNELGLADRLKIPIDRAAAPNVNQGIPFNAEQTAKYQAATKARLIENGASPEEADRLSREQE